jgi:hypothetical protein
MLQKNKTYYNLKKAKNEFLIDYCFFDGTNEHSFTFDTGKVIIKDADLDIFLLNFTELKPKKNEIMENSKTNFAKMQEILLKTMQGLENGTVKIEQAKAIASVGQTLINSVKTEGQILLSNKEKKPKFLEL